MPTHRESAHTLVRRLRAPHVSLQPPLLHDATGSGLKRGDILVVGGVPGSGKSCWAARTAALHLSNGGTVTFLYAPGSSGLYMRQFMEYLESFLEKNVQQPMQHSSYSSEKSCGHTTAGDGLGDAEMNAPEPERDEMRREALLEVLNRLTVVCCMDVNDLAVYCTQGKAAAEAELYEAVPLVIVEGCWGRGSYLYHLERAMGHQVPLCEWLFGCLRRRWRCAMVVVEEWGSAPTDWMGPSSFAGDIREGVHATNDTDELISIVERESEVLRALQADVASRDSTRVRTHSKSEAFRAGSLRASTLRSTSTAASANTANFAPSSLSSTASTLRRNATEETLGGSFNFRGNSRLYYLCIQSASPDAPALQMAHRGVSVGRLLQWRTDELTAAHPDAPSRAEALDGQQRLKRVRTSWLRGDMLCGAQL